MKTYHLFLDLPKNSFSNGTLPKIFDDNLQFPERTFPPRFVIKNEAFFCGGYFVGYNQSLSALQVLEACQARNWKFLANLVGDFLIIFCDFSTNELFVLTDQTGRFPCYFSLTGDRLLLSTDFGEVKDALVGYHLNLGLAFDYIATGLLLFPTDETVVSEIHQIPPGTLFQINSDLSYYLTAMIDLESFLGQKQPQYASLENFGNDLLSILQLLVAERLKALGSLPFAAELSSGFDSTLICYLLKKLSRKHFPCYCGFSDQVRIDTDPRIVKDFAQKHSLAVKFIVEDHSYPLSGDYWKKTAFEHPSRFIIPEIEDKHLRQTIADGYLALFQGEGGDELYSSYLVDHWAPFGRQMSYFMTVGRLNLGIEKVLTKKASEILLDRQRFANRKFYPTIVSESAVGGNLAFFPIAWESGVWSMTPFIDPRLVQLARRIPHRGLKGPAKQEVWKHRDDIFLPAQFKEKSGFENLAKLYLTKEAETVMSILKNSILGEKGWVNASQIIADIQKGNVQKYLNDDAYIYLLYALRLEYFLQNNNVKIPDGW